MSVPPVPENAGLLVQEKSILVLQQRVPETHSASPHEHQWHDAPLQGHQIRDVTMMGASVALDAAADMLSKAPVRSDTIYRTILRTTSINERMVRP